MNRTIYVLLSLVAFLLTVDSSSASTVEAPSAPPSDEVKIGDQIKKRGPGHPSIPKQRSFHPHNYKRSISQWTKFKEAILKKLPWAKGALEVGGETIGFWARKVNVVLATLDLLGASGDTDRYASSSIRSEDLERIRRYGEENAVLNKYVFDRAGHWLRREYYKPIERAYASAYSGVTKPQLGWSLKNPTSYRVWLAQRERQRTQLAIPSLDDPSAAKAMSDPEDPTGASGIHGDNPDSPDLTSKQSTPGILCYAHYFQPVANFARSADFHITLLLDRDRSLDDQPFESVREILRALIQLERVSLLLQLRWSREGENLALQELTILGERLFALGHSLAQALMASTSKIQYMEKYGPLFGNIQEIEELLAPLITRPTPAESPFAIAVNAAQAVVRTGRVPSNVTVRVRTDSIFPRSQIPLSLVWLVASNLIRVASDQGGATDIEVDLHNPEDGLVIEDRDNGKPRKEFLDGLFHSRLDPNHPNFLSCLYEAGGEFHSVSDDNLNPDYMAIIPSRGAELDDATPRGNPNYVPVKSVTIAGLDAPCSCGSGKPTKHCHIPTYKLP